MSWLAKNAVGGLLLPPCNLLLVQLAGLLLWNRRPRLSRALLVGGVAGLYLCTIPTAGVVMIESVEGRVAPLNLKEPGLAARADAIVVLGGGRILGAREFNGGDRVSPSGFMRLRYAADLWRRTSKPILLTGGAPDGGGPPEARLMGMALSEEFGIQPKWLEDRSDNTAENAEFSHRILSAQGFQRIFLVTHASHMPRAARAFRQVGFTVVPAPMGYLSDEAGGGTILGWIPSTKGLELSYLAMHEWIGALWYHLRGVD